MPMKRHKRNISKSKKNRIPVVRAGRWGNLAILAEWYLNLYILLELIGVCMYLHPKKLGVNYVGIGY